MKEKITSENQNQVSLQSVFKCNIKCYLSYSIHIPCAVCIYTQMNKRRKNIYDMQVPVPSLAYKL